jgi:lipopolysaccharide/colanic/teichoic acid biosynthesis glycosyltransferase
MPPCIDPNPSYGPLFKMKRTGYRGKPIFVYKFRTMHPYAEYLQKFVYDKFSLQEGGKFNNDFRVTSWGKVFRKLWIDELPMFINFFKGELKLVGVRPLSNHYLSLYSTELRMRRINYKPGLVPPFYVDMPKTLSEIMQSEERYLDLYDKHPVLTDIKYFFKAAYNIAIRKKRSK